MWPNLLNLSSALQIVDLALYLHDSQLNKRVCLLQLRISVATCYVAAMESVLMIFRLEEISDAFVTWDITENLVKTKVMKLRQFTLCKL